MLLNDGTITLRALEPDDLDILYRWENDTSLWAVGTTIAPFSRKQLWDYISTYNNDIFEARQLRLMITLTVTGEAVGTIDLTDFDPANARMAVGVLVDPMYTRRGYGARALELALEYGRAKLGLHQLYAYIPATNRASIALFRKCGFHSAGCLRSWLRSGRSYTDVLIVQRLLS